MTENASIDLDRLHTVHRDGNRWLLQKKTPDGKKDIDRWAGPLSSLRRRLTEHGIVPDREADAKIRNLSELGGFRDRSEV